MCAARASASKGTIASQAGLSANAGARGTANKRCQGQDANEDKVSIGTKTLRTTQNALRSRAVNVPEFSTKLRDVRGEALACQADTSRLYP